MSTANATDEPVPGPHAHSLEGRCEAEWELLSAHLLGVGAKAARFGAVFGAGAAAMLAGCLHDIGKAAREWQAYIRGGRQVGHSTAGAIEAEALFADGPGRLIGRLVAFAIAGHHAGLSDGDDLVARLAGDLPNYAAWRALRLPLPEAITPQPAGRSRNTDGYRLAFLGRMIFSCLVDADRLETERYYADAEGVVIARGDHAPLSELKERLDRRLARFDGSGGALNARRTAILRHAREKAALPPGLFTMTVPTGGGKTLAGLAFALDHAVAHGLRRIVYAAPYAEAWIETV